jgi:hypothetical protein
MKGNVPIVDLPSGEDVWLTVAVTSVREIRPQQGRPFFLANARNASGTIALKIASEILQSSTALKPGLWGVVGRLETYQNQPQFVVSELRPITAEKYRELQNADPLLPRAFTIDIETIPLPAFRQRATDRLERETRKDE